MIKLKLCPIQHEVRDAYKALMENEDDFDGFDTRCIYMCVYVMCLDIYNVAYDVGSTYMHVEESNLMSTIHW